MTNKKSSAQSPRRGFYFGQKKFADKILRKNSADEGISRRYEDRLSFGRRFHSIRDFQEFVIAVEYDFNEGVDDFARFIEIRIKNFAPHFPRRKIFLASPFD